MLTRDERGQISAAPPSQRDENRRWFSAEDPSELLWTSVRSMRNRQSWKRNADELALLLYSDMQYVGFRGGEGTSAQMSDVLDTRMGDNVIRAIVRVLNSKIARRRSRPYVVTNGGSWQQRNSAEMLEKWLLGKLRSLRADEELLPMLRLHALVFGTGCLRSYADPVKGAMLEIVPPNEIVVDDSEARYGEPRNLYFVRVVDRGVLRAAYPDKAELIDQSSASLDTDWAVGLGAWDNHATNDLAVTIEAFHLPSGPGAGDGRHLIAVRSGALLDEEWKRDHFPCAWMRGELRPAGFWGIGVPEDLSGAQIEINRTTLAIQEMIDTLAAPYWLVERGMKVVKGHISNLIGRVMEYTASGSGAPPQVVAPPVVPQEMWSHRDQLKRSSFEARGVSQLSAQMLKPAGLNSGKALRAYTELESELLADLMANAEDALLRACHLLIEEQMEVADTEAEQKVTYVGAGKVERIDWTDIKLKEDLTDYVLEILPASALASTLSARIEDVYDLQQLGAVSEPQEVWDYLDLPDRKRMRRKMLSHKHLLERVIEDKIVRQGQHVQPEPTWDLELAMKIGLQAINELELYEDAPASRLELLRQFVVSCKQIIDMAAQAEAEAAQAAQMAQMEAQGGVAAPGEMGNANVGTDAALGDAGIDPGALGGPGAGGPGDLGSSGAAPI